MTLGVIAWVISGNDLGTVQTPGRALENSDGSQRSGTFSLAVVRNVRNDGSSDSALIDRIGPLTSVGRARP
jgi:hypothetical protein